MRATFLQVVSASMSAFPVSLGPAQLLPSGRLARQVSVNRSDEAVFIDKDGVTCCRHGERGATIQAWINSERVDPNFKRPSVCDCGNLDGLLTCYDITPIDYPMLDKSGSLYKLLGTTGADEVKVNSRPQRLALKTGETEIWIQPTGTIVCKHGNSRKVIARMKKAGSTRSRSLCTIPCSCNLSIPRRVGSIIVTKATREGGE